MRIPKHIAIIPDGNRRWAQAQGYRKQDGYRFGLDPGWSACVWRMHAAYRN